MNKSIASLLIVFIFFNACKEHKNEVVSDQASSDDVLTFTIRFQPTAFDAKVDSLVKAWPEFMAYEAGIRLVARATKVNDLELSIEQLKDHEIKLVQSTFPAPLDYPQVRSRMSVLRTYLLQTEGAIKLRDSLQIPVEKLLQADDNMRKQMNRILKIQEDEKSILGEGL